MTLLPNARLSRRSLDRLPGIVLPGYDMTAVTPGIVHIGLGGFHRAHLARYTHDLMNSDPSSLIWGIVGAGLRASDAPLLKALARQEGLYTLVERDVHGEERTVIGSLVRTIDASADSAALLDAIAASTIRIVSITVSEHGYHLDAATRTLDLDDPAIRRDISMPRRPATLIGILVESYRRRRDAGQTAFTALSCDNIHENGEVLRSAVLAFSQEVDPSLATWIEDQAAFPCSMVDRITPVPSSEQIAAFREETGSVDEAPVFAEAFRQWVIEDRFCTGRPDWDRVGAQFVNDVSPYEKMKLRLLNASHLAIAGLGVLAGLETVRDAIEDLAVRLYMQKLMQDETAPTLPPVPGVDLVRYQSELIERFDNPAIHDKLQRINADAPVNLLLDPIRDRLAASASIDLLGLALAAWLKRVKLEASLPSAGRTMGKSEHQLQDRARAGCDPLTFLSASEIFGDVGSHPTLLSCIQRWLGSLETAGVHATLRNALAQRHPARMA